jgi:predicted secreted protein
MGGMGKTQLALEYAYRFRSHYHCIFWLAADRGPELAQNLAEIAEILAERRYLNPKLLESMGQSRVIKEVMRWFERTSKWVEVYLPLN